MNRTATHTSKTHGKLTLKLIGLFIATGMFWHGTTIARAQTATILTDHSAYYPGERIVASFQNGPGNPKDWIGIYPDGVEPGSVASTLWFYVNGTRTSTTGQSEGTIAFPTGLNLAGDWVAFLLLNDGYNKLAQTSFKIVDPSTPLVRTDKRVYSPGETITVTFTNGPGNPKDWIGFYKKGVKPGSTPSTIWNYVNGTHTATTGKSSGTVTFAGGLAQTGDYDVQFLLNDGYDVLATETVTVAPSTALKPRILSLQPANNTSNAPPVLEFVASITNGTTKVAASTVTLKFDGTKVTHVFALLNELVTISYTNQTLLAPKSQHTYELVFADTATPANTFTNLGTFTVSDYKNIVLPAPLYFEDFDSTPEGKLPSGWTEKSFTEIQIPDFDFGDLNSATYATWTVVNADRFKGSFVTYSNPDNPQGWEDDYHRVISVNPLNVVNGKVLKEPLATGRFLFGDSGYRNGKSQVLYVSTPDFNLSGKSDVFLSFHSLWEQNQDSLGGVEYSIDEGKTWWPIVYMIDSPDVLKDARGNVDAVQTLTTEYGDVARFTDPVTGEDKGGSYGAFIGAAIGPDLAPFISARVNDNPVESKRVELFRLPKADNQSKVRIRFVHAGTDSWYFGIDDFGLYSIPHEDVFPKLSVTKAGNNLSISWPAGISGFVLESADALPAASWTPVTGVANNGVTITLPIGMKFYRLRKQ